MSGYTKGRWVVEIGSDHTSVGTMTNGVFYPHAQLIEDETYDADIDVAEAQANARLIAAAPELLDALDEALNRMEQFGAEINGREFRPQCTAAIAYAKKVIAKAVGKDTILVTATPLHPSQILEPQGDSQ